MSARSLAVLAFGVAFLSLAAPVTAQVKGPYTVSVTAEPGRWTGIRLQNLTKGAYVAIEVKTDGVVDVALLDAADLNRYPAIVRPLFRGRADKTLAFSVTTPAAGDYFVVFDNRGGDAPRAITLTVAAARTPPGRATEDGLRRAERQLAELERKLGQLFVFDPFPIRVTECGTAGAASSDSGVLLCAEYARALYIALKDQKRANEALAFTFLQKMADVLVAQWKAPVFDKTGGTDELATALLAMIGWQKRLRPVIEHFAANPDAAETVAKAFRDDQHLLTAPRARNIARWLDDPQLVRRWQIVLVPHMQTRFLELLRARPTPWTDLELVRAELAKRK